MAFKQNVCNLTLAVASLALTYLVLELIFPFVLHRVPLTLYNGLNEGIRVLGQSSKTSAVPKTYIALVGDSYAQGQGDWLKKEIRRSKFNWSNSDYHSGHLIFRKTGKDVITFGTAGAGSIKGLVTAPIIQYSYINSLWPFTLEPPSQILVYFFEGNDFTGNYHEYIVRFRNLGYDLNSFYDTSYFDKFLQKEALDRYPLYKNSSLLRHFIFGSFLAQGWENAKKEIKRGKRKLKAWWESREKKHQTGMDFKIPIRRISLNPPATQDLKPNNVTLIGGREVTLNPNLQAPPVMLDPEQMKTAVYIFERALIFMAGFFKQSKIAVLYLPSPLSVYRLEGPTISYEKGTADNFTLTENITQTSREGCLKIQGVAKRNGFQFLDTRPFLREAAKTRLVHGPEDPNHLNQYGYTVLAEAIVNHLLTDLPDPKNGSCQS